MKETAEKTPKKRSVRKILLIILAVVAGLAVIAAAVIWGVWHNEILSVLSMEHLSVRNDEHQDGSVYEMHVSGGYYFDDYLAQGGASNDGDLIDFITGNITKGLIDMTISESSIGCSSFTGQTAEGDRIFGRNYDFDKTNTCIVFTNPGGDRHASVSTVDLQFLGIDQEADVTSLMDKIKCLAAPYAPLDGMNDAGVSCGIYMTYQGPGEEAVPTDQDTGKPDLTSTTMLRLILDYADSVDEAVELISEYDLHDSANTSYHYMVADATGKSAILEWIAKTDAEDTDGSQRELKITYYDADPATDTSAYQCVTNFIVSPDYYENEEDMKGLDRYEHLLSSLEEREGIFADEEDAMTLLSEVGRRSWDNDDANGCTVHSAVYNLTDKTVLWTGNEHYGEEGYVFEYAL